MRRTLLLVLLFVTSTSVVAASPDPDAILKAYRVERADAATRFPAESLAPADALAKQAEEAMKANPAAAARIARDARWRLPYAPPGLPPHVARVLGGGRLRHSDRVNALAYGPDGTTLVTASRDGTVKLWALASGRELFAYRGLAELGPTTVKEVNDDVLKVASVAFSKSNVIACGGYGEIHLIDPATGKLIHALKGHVGTVKSLAFRPDGERLASVGDDKSIRVWDPAKGVELLKLEPPKPAFGVQPAGNVQAVTTNRYEAIAYAPKGDRIAVTNQDGRLAVYDVSGKDMKLKLGASVVNQAGGVFAVKFTPDGTGLYTAGDASTPPRLTAGPAPDQAAALPVAGVAPAVRGFAGHAANRKVGCLDISPDGTLLVTGSEDQTCRVWEANTGKPLKLFAAHGAEVTALAIRPDGNEVASADEAGIVRVWPLAAVDEHATSNEATDIVWAVAVSPNGAKYAAAGADRLIRVYDAANGNLLRTLRGHKAAITALCFLDDDTVASAGGDRTALVWSLKDESSPRTFAGHTSVVLAVAAVENGRKFVTGAVDRTMKLWDVATGKVLATFDVKSAVCAMATRKDGPRIAVGTADGWVALFDVTDKGFTRISTSAGHTAGVAALTLRPDGREVVSVGGDGLVRVWTVGAKDELVSRFVFEAVANPTGNVPYILSAATYSTDGKLFAVAGQEGLVRLYDDQSGRETRTLRGHLDWVTGVAFAPDGKTALAAGTDKTVRRFPLAESDSAPTPGHTRSANSVAVSPDGTTAVTVAPDELKWWDLATGRERATISLASQRTNAITFAGPNAVVLGGGDGQKLTWFDLPSGKLSKTTPVSGRTIYSLAAAGPDAIAVWQVRLDSTEFVVVKAGVAGTPFLLPGKDKGTKNVTCAAITPDATLAVAGQDGKNVTVIDLTAQKQVGNDWPLFDAAPVDIALSADKSTVFCIDGEGTIKVAKLADRTVTAKAKAHPNGSNGLILARSGDRFATLGTDGEIKAWDANAKELRSWILPVEVKSATFAPDGRSIVTANGDGSAYVLAVP